MMFNVDMSHDARGGVDATAVDEFALTGSTLTQLRNFFEHHTFDTAGAYSDLFSVLLSCCKHLVDASLRHHVALSDQRQEVCRLSLQTGALSDVTSRCQKDICELKSFPLERGDKSPLPPAARDSDADILREGLEEARRQLHETNTEVLDLRRRQKELERQQMEYNRLQEGTVEQMRQLEKDVSSLKHDIVARVERIPDEDALRHYTDDKVEALRSDVCAAICEAALRTDADDVKTPTDHTPTGRVCVEATCAVEKSDGHDGVRDGLRGGLTSALRCLESRASRSIQAHVERLESRLEVLEVYAPHYCAMASRPPVLGLELRDEKGVGVRVEKVFSGFAGETAGVMPGDFLIAVNGQEVSTRAEMYALMTEIVKEHQTKCRLLMQMYFKRHVGQNNKAGGGDVRQGSEPDGCWELPQLEFRLHLKRGGLLREISLFARLSNIDA